MFRLGASHLWLNPPKARAKLNFSTFKLWVSVLSSNGKANYYGKCTEILRWQHVSLSNLNFVIFVLDLTTHRCSKFSHSTAIQHFYYMPVAKLQTIKQNGEPISPLPADYILMGRVNQSKPSQTNQTNQLSVQINDMSGIRSPMGKRIQNKEENSRRDLRDKDA